MNTRFCLILLLAGLTFKLQAQLPELSLDMDDGTGEALGLPGDDQSSGPALAASESAAEFLSLQEQTPADPSHNLPARADEKGRDFIRWERVWCFTNHPGAVAWRTNSYVELETAKHYWLNGKWKESREEIDIVTNGAVARRDPHKVAFASNINSPVSVEVLAPDSKRIKFRVLGMAYYDFQARTNGYVLIAELKDSIGQLVGTNQVVYPDAFTDFRADVRYTYKKASLEQDLILRQLPPLPEEFGLNPVSTRLLVLTEFIDSPEDAQVIQSIRRGWKKDTVHPMIDFGAMKIGQGLAFSLGMAEEQNRGIPVQKHWVLLEGRRFLIEEVSFQRIAPHLRDLQSSARPASGGSAPLAKRLASSRLQRPCAQPTSVPGHGPMQVAMASPDEKGLVLDFPLVTGTSQVLRGDTTYLVNGEVNLSGTTQIEGGTVVKYNEGAQLKLLGAVQCLTGPYHPAIFTAKDDDSVGDQIYGSTGHPENKFYAACALSLGPSSDLSYVHVRYAKEAIFSGYDYKVSHAQFVSCHHGLHSESANFTNCNVLMYQVDVPYYGSWFYGRVEHLTCDQASFLGGDWDFGYLWWCHEVPSSSLTLINSITASLRHGFGLIPVIKDHVQDDGVFTSVGAGAHYLSDDSNARNAGTTEIQPELAKTLKSKTIFPPLLYSNITFSTDKTFSAQAQRDTEAPDLGYHYDPIDYLACTCTIANATLRITDGAVIGYIRALGICLDGSAILSEGKPGDPNRFVDYRLAQEQPLRLGTGRGVPVWSASFGSSGRFRFTEFDWVYAPPNLENVCSFEFDPLELTSCTFRNGDVKVDTAWTYHCGSAGLTNNLFLGGWHCFAGGFGTFAAFNNLFHHASTWFDLFDEDGWEGWLIRDNAFDSGYVCNEFWPIFTHDRNAYINTTRENWSSELGEIVLPSFTYTSGPLGDYYQSSTGLVNAGSRSAADAGLYHYTTRANLVNGHQVKEGDDAVPTVDIGFHYVATNEDGVPIDSDADGWPDYIEDTNGNGLLDSGDRSDWLFLSAQPCGSAIEGLRCARIPGQ